MSEENTGYIDEPGETVTGFYNLKSSSLSDPNKGHTVFGLSGRHSYDYVPQYLIKEAERQIESHYSPGIAEQIPTAQGATLTVTGPAVNHLIRSEYARKGYSASKAHYIANAVAGKEHRRRMKKMLVSV